MDYDQRSDKRTTIDKSKKNISALYESGLETPRVLFSSALLVLCLDIKCLLSLLLLEGFHVISNALAGSRWTNSNFYILMFY